MSACTLVYQNGVSTIAGKSGNFTSWTGYFLSMYMNEHQNRNFAPPAARLVSFTIHNKQVEYPVCCVCINPLFSPCLHCTLLSASPLHLLILCYESRLDIIDLLIYKYDVYGPI